jgi:hypothetical protein
VGGGCLQPICRAKRGEGAGETLEPCPPPAVGPGQGSGRIYINPGWTFAYMHKSNWVSCIYAFSAVWIQAISESTILISRVHALVKHQIGK